MANALSACAARRWLERNAAGVKLICNEAEATPSACASLVSCLPALETAVLYLCGPLSSEELGGLLEALAWCPRLRALDLCTVDEMRGAPQRLPASGCAPAFAKLRSLRKLTLSFGGVNHVPLATLVDALVPLTGLAELSIALCSAVLPAALGQLKGLQALSLCSMKPCVFEAGCFDLPKLQSLDFQGCVFEDAVMLPSATGLQSLRHVRVIDCQGPSFFARFPSAHFPELPLVTMYSHGPWHRGAHQKLARLPADFSSAWTALQRIEAGHELTQFLLALTQLAALEHLNLERNEFAELLKDITALFNINGRRLTCFPPALTQLVAFECLNAERKDFAEVPVAITALSRLTELRLGRVLVFDEPMQLHDKRPLDARALGDLSGFPALCELTFSFCEVTVCQSLLGAAQHISVASLTFFLAYFAPECALMLLNLRQALSGTEAGQRT